MYCITNINSLFCLLENCLNDKEQTLIFSFSVLNDLQTYQPNNQLG